MPLLFIMRTGAGTVSTVTSVEMGRFTALCVALCPGVRVLDTLSDLRRCVTGTENSA